MRHCTALLFFCHFWDGFLDDEYSELSGDAAGFDHFLLYDNSRRDAPAIPHIHRFTVNSLAECGLPAEGRIVPGNTILAVLNFRQHYPEYAQYWVIEYDVRFSGAWQVFFAAWDACRADLVVAGLGEQAAHRDWAWWRSFRSSKTPPQLWRAFFPVYRISREALDDVERAMRSGVRGHHEVLIPTVLQAGGRTIDDLDGDRQWTTTLQGGRTLTDAPARPVIGPDENKLWHPVKPSMFSQRPVEAGPPHLEVLIPGTSVRLGLRLALVNRTVSISQVGFRGNPSARLHRLLRLLPALLVGRSAAHLRLSSADGFRTVSGRDDHEAELIARSLRRLASRV